MKASMNSLSRGPLAALFGLVVLFACISFSRPAYADRIFRGDDAPLVGGDEFEGRPQAEHIVVFEDKNHDWDKEKKGKKFKFDNDGDDGNGGGSGGVNVGGSAGVNGGDPTPVPEPSSMVLLSTALLGLAVAGRRKLFG